MFINTHRQYPIFKGLTDNEIEEILKHSHTEKHHKGKILVHQGDIPLYLYYIIDGGLITTRSNSDGAITAIRLCEKGETCMDAVIFMDSNSPIEVQATKNSEILHIDSLFVKRFAEENIQFANNLIYTVAKYYKKALYQLDGLSIKPTKERVGYYLLQNYLLSDSDNFIMQFSHNIVASHLGMTIETLSRALHHIKKLGIEVKGSKVIISNIHALCSFCDENTFGICKNRSEKCTIILPKCNLIAF
jgi:CRP-like cAMP-binding protein